MFGIKLKQLRLARGLTQTQVAAAVRVSSNYYCELEAGKYAPSLEVVVRLADFFRVSVDYLLGR